MDRFSTQDIGRWKDIRDRVLKFHWDFHSELARQRAGGIERLKASLARNAHRGFEFFHWQRVASYRHALEPLSTRGSLTDPGGRFNVGDIEPTAFPPFPALYTAEDKETALQEALAQDINPRGDLDAFDYALLNPKSIAVFSLSGKLDSVLDLNNKACLEEFISLIKNFHIPENLVKTAKHLRLDPVELIRTVDKLLEALLKLNWRIGPMHFDVPAPSQIFGNLVMEAGIEGILYPSKFNAKPCLAIFPKNMEGADSFVRLDDPAPTPSVVTELTSATWRSLV